ncbi:MAG: glycosyltransferase family 2 protein [Butyrivibrio sp.]|nr:glycosyltransferase family 2 protein [Butyrivibrio sp.]
MNEQTRIEILISAVDAKDEHLNQMNIQTDAVFINQCGRDEKRVIEHKSYLVKWIDSSDKGVGASRNLALKNADHEFIQFADEDIVYDEGYAARVEAEFDAHPEADMLTFNVRQSEGRFTYENTDYHNVKWNNYGRYAAYAIVARTDKLLASGVKFSLLFGGGAKYSAGEDSLFLHDCLKAGLNIYTSTQFIGHEISRKSTWFEGYTDKFFFDRGVLYHFLYGKMAVPLGIRYILKNKEEFCKEKSAAQCIKLLANGVKEGRGLSK